MGTPRREAQPVSFRDDLRPSDREAVAEVIRATGFFSSSEERIALELVEERLERGEASGYHFVLAERAAELAAYCCYGEIPCTVGSFDLYWIAVHPRAQGGGLGRALLELAEERIARLGGRRIYVETSNRAQYHPTRAFYERCRYVRVAVLADFYAPGDDKVVYAKELQGQDPSPRSSP